MIATAQADAGAGCAPPLQRAVELLGDTGGLLRIEDVLPLFPDFTQIDQFKARARGRSPPFATLLRFCVSGRLA